MKNLNKKVGIVIATALILTPAISFANEMEMESKDSGTISSNTDYYTTFKKEFYEQLSQGNFTEIDKRISGYEGDVKYLSENTDSPYYSNLSIYEKKLNALKELKENFKSHIKTISTEQQENLKALKTRLEEEIKTLRESITAENIEEIKAKAEELKAEFLEKAEELGLTEYKKMIEERFKIFYNANFTKKEDFKKLVDQKKEELKKISEEKKAEWEVKKEEMKKLAEQKKEEYKKIAEEQKAQWGEKKEEFKQKVEDTKQNFKNLKQDIKAKYKEAFAKKLEGKIDNLGAEKLKAVIAKIDTVIAKYQANTTLTAEQKEKFVAQLNAVKELLQEKLDELENGINLDELLGE